MQQITPKATTVLKTIFFFPLWSDMAPNTGPSIATISVTIEMVVAHMAVALSPEIFPGPSPMAMALK